MLRLPFLALVVIPLACGSSGGPGANRDGGTQSDSGQVADGGPDQLTLEGAPRSCSVVVRHRAPSASTVMLAGDFTAWGDGALPMTRIGDSFELTLSPQTHSQLRPGALHSYKLIVDGDWQLHANASHRAYDDGCLNSAFLVPDCSAQPAVSAEPVVATLTGATGQAQIRFRLHPAADNIALTKLDIELDGAAVQLSDVTRDNDLYTLMATALTPGKHRIRIRLTDAMDRVSAPVFLPFWIEQTPFSLRDAVMYMLVVDRFANGDTTIDAPEPADEVEYPANWHGGDLWGALEVMKTGYFDQLGVNMIWLSPINQQATGSFAGRDDHHKYTGYHGYWPTRGRDVDPRFGGNEALRAFVDEAHRRGIRVLFDLINNQVHEQHEYVATSPDWFRQFPASGICGITPGWDWSQRPFECLFASYLPDINWLVPDAERQFVGDALFWLEEIDIDGYRIDAVKHVETNSTFNLRAAVAQRFEQSGTRVVMLGETAVTEGDTLTYGCGEHYSSGYDWIDAYVGDKGLDGQFDFPTHHQMQQQLLQGQLDFNDLESIVRKIETRYDPAGVHVQFLGTHDSTRMATQATGSTARSCKWQGDPVRDWDDSIIDDCTVMPALATDALTFAKLKRAFTITMTLPGIPFIYYGDEIAMPGGNDPDNRRDMTWTGQLAGVGMGNGPDTLAPQQAQLLSWVQALGQARRASVALRRGRRVPLVASSDLYVYAYVGPDGDLALVAINKGSAVANLPIELSAADHGSATSLTAVVGTGVATFSASGIELTLGAGEATVFAGANN